MTPSSLSFDDIKRSIKERSHAPVPFPLRKKDFAAAIDTFVAFLQLPLEVKEKIYFRVTEEGRGSEVGYRRYRRDEGQTDNREYFHYHAYAEERFTDARAEYKELDLMMNAMRPIYAAAVETLKQVITAFDTRFPGLYDRFFNPDNVEGFYLRFLKYDRARPGEFLAKGHYDRGTCTLALTESSPGLRTGSNDQDLKEVVHKEGEALFMPALHFQTITSSDFPPTWHDVVQRGEDVYSDDIARWAIVFFADYRNASRTITYEEAHTPKR